jgi:signal transduction histidine kinase
LGRTMVGPMQALERVTERLRGGDLHARVEPRGPPEMADVGRAVNQLAERIGDLIAQEREATADLSHQLRTPLTVVQLEADSITDPQERIRVGAAVAGLTDAVSAVITEARRPRAAPAAAPNADLVVVVRRRMAFWTVLAQEQGRQPSVTLPEDPCLVRLSADDLVAVIDAILTNVFTHTPPAARFAVTVDDRGHLPVLRVDDSGPGFGHGLPRRGRSANGSTGLGLDIVRRSAEHSGGCLRLSRAAAKAGARVEVLFGRASPPVTLTSRSAG